MDRSRLWIAVAAVVSVAIIALGWFLGVKPRLDESAIAVSERESVQAANLTYEAALAKLKKLDSDLPALQRDLTELQAALPEDAQVSTLLGQLNAIAAQSGVELSSITAGVPTAVGEEEPDAEAAPAPAEGETAAEPVPAASVTSTSSASGLVAVPITVTSAGDPNNLLTFVSGVQFGTRLFLVTGVKTAIDGAGGTVEISGVVFVIPKAAESDAEEADSADESGATAAG